jgi:GT2 family glycosyltransferase
VSETLAPAASVIIVTYNAREFVGDCLAALAAQTFNDFETVVVDNASPDGTADHLRDHSPPIKVIAAQTNGGYGAGNNLGAAHARGEILVFLNPDAVPNPYWLANLINAMRGHGRQFATSKIVLQSDPQRLNSGGNQIHYLGLSFCRGLNAPASCYALPELVTGASGAACAITRTLFTRVGGFDPTFFLYHDDVDLSLRALLAGEPCLYVPTAVVAHNYDQSVPPRKWGWVEAHRYAVLLKAFTWRTLLVLSPALIAVDVMTFAYLASRGPDYVAAKISSYAWLFHHVATIREDRRRAQATRRLSDGQILSGLASSIPYEQLCPGWVARIASVCVDPWFRVYRVLTLVAVQ